MDVRDVHTNGHSGLRCRNSSKELSIVFACSLAARLRGLHAYDEFDEVLALMPCRDIHTFGMKRPLDVVFIAADGKVLKSIRKLMPNKRMRCKRAIAVLERYSCQDNWPEEGSRIDFGWSLIKRD